MTPLIAKSSRTGASEPVIDAEGPPPVCDEHDDEADKEGLILTRLPGNVPERQHVICDQDQSGSRGDARARAEQQQCDQSARRVAAASSGPVRGRTL